MAKLGFPMSSGIFIGFVHHSSKRDTCPLVVVLFYSAENKHTHTYIYMSSVRFMYDLKSTLHDLLSDSKAHVMTDLKNPNYRTSRH